MTYFVISPKGDESLNSLLRPDPGDIRGGPSHGYNASCGKKSNSTRVIVFELRVLADMHRVYIGSYTQTDGQTDTCVALITSHSITVIV